MDGEHKKNQEDGAFSNYIRKELFPLNCILRSFTFEQSVLDTHFYDNMGYNLIQEQLFFSFSKLENNNFVENMVRPKVIQ